MKAKKRVVTTRDVRGPGSKRTPTVRRIKPAIVPVARPRAPADAGPDVRPAAAAVARTSEPVGDLSSDPAFDPTVDVGRGLRFANPVVAGSGAFGYGVEAADAADLARIGGLVTRGTTLRPRHGAPPPRMAEAPAGLISAVGLQNPGVDVVVERYGRAWPSIGVPVVVNVGGETVGEVVDAVRRLEGVAGVAAVELNLSCPNASRGGTLFALDPSAAAALVAGVRRATDLPVLAKLSAAATDVRAVATAVEEAGADGITAIHSVPAMAVGGAGGPERGGGFGPALGSPYGGLSGPAIRPVALRVVAEVASVVRIPVLGAGGVQSLADVLAFLAVGAVAVQVCTAAFADPGLPARLAQELTAECRRRGLASPRGLVGGALPSRLPPSTKGGDWRG